jgi:hypothetical protein
MKSSSPAVPKSRTRAIETLFGCLLLVLPAAGGCKGSGGDSSAGPKASAGAKLDTSPAGKPAAETDQPKGPTALCDLVPRDEFRSTLGLSAIGERTVTALSSTEAWCRFGTPNAADIRFDTRTTPEIFALKKKSMASMQAKDVPGAGDQAFIVSMGKAFSAYSLIAIKGTNGIQLTTTESTADKTIALAKKILAKL